MFRQLVTGLEAKCKNVPDRQYEIYVSAIEVMNEMMKDLLNPRGSTLLHFRSKSDYNVSILEN